MKTKISIILIVLLPILILVLLAFFLFGLFSLYKTVREPDLMGLVISLMFIWFSAGISSLLFNEFRSFELKNRTLLIREILSGRTTETDLSKVKYKEFDWGEMYSIKMKGILLKIDQNRAIQLNRANFRNSNEFIGLIKEKCVSDESIELKTNYRKLKIFMIFGIIVLTLFGIHKLI